MKLTKWLRTDMEKKQKRLNATEWERFCQKHQTTLFFLTATPHKGDPENFRLFLDLLVPGFFASSEMVEESLKNKDNPLFIIPIIV